MRLDDSRIKMLGYNEDSTQRIRKMYSTYSVAQELTAMVCDILH